MTSEHSTSNGVITTDNNTNNQTNTQQKNLHNHNNIGVDDDDSKDNNNADMTTGNSSNSTTTRKRKNTGQDGSSSLMAEEMTKAEAMESHIQQAISHTWVVPDGGYGWVVMVCSLFISVIVDGVTYTFGVFLNDFEEAFQEPKSTITLANSLQVGLYLISGPVVSALTNRFGCRPVVIVGSIVVGVSFILSAFSPNISVLIFTYGVMGGIGFGMMYLPSVVAVSIYFDKKRALATGIAVCGSGIGTFVMAPLSEILIMEYTWRWTMILLGGVVFNGIVCGALIRPLELRFDEKSAKIVDIQMEDDDDVDDEKSMGSSVLNRVSFSAQGEKQKEKERPETIPLLTLTDDAENTSVISPAQSESQKTKTATENTNPHLEIPGASKEKTNGGGDYKFFSSTPNFSSSTGNQNQPRRGSVTGNKRQKADSLTGRNEILDVRSGTRNRSLTLSVQGKLSPTGSSRGMGSRTMSHAPMGLAFIGVSDMYINKLRDDLAIPLSRKDINRSMAHIMEFGDAAAAGVSMRSLDSHISSCKNIAFDDDLNAGKSKGIWSCLPESARDTFDEMMNLSIFEEKRYWFVIAGNFVCMIGFYVPFVYIPGRAMEMGVSDNNAAFLISIIGITNLIGRVATGVLVNYLPIEPVLVTTIALALGGLVTMICPFCESYAALVVIAAIFGLCVAAYISLCSILLCELLGVRNLTNAFGYVILFRGIACIMGPPIAGALIDSTGSFDPAFYVGGGMIALGSLFHLFLLTPCIKRLEPS